MTLPKGWVECVLSDVVRLINGDRGKNYPSKDKLSTDSSSGLPFISAVNLTDGKIKIEGLLYLSEKQYDLLGSGKFQKNDIIFCLRGSLGKNAVSQLQRGAIASSLVLLRLHSSEPMLRYIGLYVNSPLLFSEIKKYDNGTAQPNLSANNLASFKMPLPPLAEQHRIVAKIDALFSELDKGVEVMKTMRAQLRTYRQAVLKWAFEGELTAIWRKENSSESWQIVSILKLIKNERNALKAGPFGSSLKKNMYKPDGYKIYGQEQVIKGDENYGDYFIDGAKYNELISCKIAPNDVLISLVGTIGKVLILSPTCLPGIINPRLIKISLNEKVMLPKFFKFYFESGYLKSLYKAKAHGETMDVLNLGMIKELPFPLCSVDEQKEIVAEIESRLSICDKLEQIVDESLAKAQALRQSILKKAFAGELVPQDPNDEPAEKLLERIKAMKADAAKTTTARRIRK
jgi:type I restriction enzyme, S subunit